MYPQYVAGLTDVLVRAGLPSGEAVCGKLLSTVVVATGRDSYRAVFTIGELDHLLGNAPVIVADKCDGAPLADGPIRLVAAADKRGARSVRQLNWLSVVENCGTSAAVSFKPFAKCSYLAQLRKHRMR